MFVYVLCTQSFEEECLQDGVGLYDTYETGHMKNTPNSTLVSKHFGFIHEILSLFFVVLQVTFLMLTRILIFLDMFFCHL